jgi:putative CocE/NonD family hydrolase
MRCVPFLRIGFLVAISFALSLSVRAQEFSFPEAAVSDPAVLGKAVPELAQQVLASYKESDRGKYLDNLFRLQILAGRYAEGIDTIHSLRELLRAGNPPLGDWVNLQYEVYARGKMLERAQKLTFDQAYTRAFREAFAHMDDRTAALVIRALDTVDPADSKRDAEGDLAQQKGKTTIALADAVNLLRDDQVAESYSAAPLNKRLIAEDDERRYAFEKDIRVKTPDGATVCAMTMRPRAATGRLTTLLVFTIYVDPAHNMSDARMTASHGYAGVIGFTRGKACSPDKPVPYLYDGADASALIDWIMAQAWSDGRVGMYTGSYNGFTQWATAKYMPKGLKAMMMGAPAAPGVDVPMEGNVFWNFIFSWPLYTTNAKGADDATYSDRNRWRKLDHEFYVSGRAYRDLEKIDGTPNPFFDEWISHPGYDAYWQAMIPYEKEFARINIPVLQTVGYYFGGPGAAVYYFSEHHKYDPQAEDYLVIGPYHHLGAQYGVVGLMGELHPSLAGLKLDPVALVDLVDLRYAWFDYLFKGAPKPALLQDKVNYQVVGANAWKHAPSLAAMAGGSLRFYLSSTAGATENSTHRLSAEKPADDGAVDLKVDLADRSDVDRKAPGGGLVADAVDPWNGVEYMSDQLPKATEVSGLFSGRLDFECNKRDFDFEINLYEQTPAGKYVFLTSYWARTSYVRDRNRRQLLTPGKRERLDFNAIRLMSRQMSAGSRLVVLLHVIKEPGRQINYGTGKDVSNETIADAGAPLQIKWYGDSYIDFPVGR